MKVCNLNRKLNNHCLDKTNVFLTLPSTFSGSLGLLGGDSAVFSGNVVGFFAAILRLEKRFLYYFLNFAHFFDSIAFFFQYRASSKVSREESLGRKNPRGFRTTAPERHRLPCDTHALRLVDGFQI